MLALGVIHRLETGARDAGDGHFGAIDNRREGRAADAAQTRYSEAAALHFLDLELAFTRFGRQFRQVTGDIEYVLLVHVAHYGYYKAIRRFAGKTDVEIVLEDQAVAI